MATVVEALNPANTAALKVDSQGRLLVAIAGGGGGGGGLSEDDVKALIAEAAKTPQLASASQNGAITAAQYKALSRITAGPVTPQAPAGKLLIQGDTEFSRGVTAYSLTLNKTPSEDLDAVTVGYLKTQLAQAGGGGGSTGPSLQWDTLVWDAGVSKDGIFNRWHENNEGGQTLGTWTKDSNNDANFTPKATGVYRLEFWFNTQAGITQIILSQGGRSLHNQGAVFMANVSSYLTGIVKVPATSAIRVQLRTTEGATRVCNAIITKLA